MRNYLLSTLTLLVFIFSIGSQGCDIIKDNETIKIGALVPLTGDMNKVGAAMLEALLIAEKDINDSLTAQNSSKQIELVYYDTESSAQTCQEQLDTLIAQDLRFIIGPMSSDELSEIKDSINNSNALLISPSSTSSTLAVADDNIYRFVSSDKDMSTAIAESIWDTNR